MRAMDGPTFELRFARSEADRLGAARLRYAVFVEELGGGGAGTDHAARIEADPFDPFCRHLILADPGRPLGDHVVGLYRLMDRAGAEAAGGFYGEGEYDLSPLLASGKHLLELGRSCLAPEYRGGAAMHRLWGGLAALVKEEGVEVVFGVASFHGTDPMAIAQELTALARGFEAPPELRPRARVWQQMRLLPEAGLDRKAAMLAMPALIKAYLRLGGLVGDGAYIDHEFNTIDVCMVMETGKLSPRARAIYDAGRRR